MHFLGPLLVLILSIVTLAAPKILTLNDTEFRLEDLVVFKFFEPTNKGRLGYIVADFNVPDGPFAFVCIIDLYNLPISQPTAWVCTCSLILAQSLPSFF